ncbi:hypothetical protein DM01DRAFT_97132 [Hesseltinella vesiculosa]|uniref:Uncharacterized protein n=1 Tax=Hesseltinella vesiculosa TaxID=101127 RepID=A0A1X2GM55_9FUNG|nr:hypothetical protein DM01DRAFT_97132 [Hesseltinella vesiculosa]
MSSNNTSLKDLLEKILTTLQTQGSTQIRILNDLKLIKQQLSQHEQESQIGGNSDATRTLIPKPSTSGMPSTAEKKECINQLLKEQNEGVEPVSSTVDALYQCCKNASLAPIDRKHDCGLLPYDETWKELSLATVLDLESSLKKYLKCMSNPILHPDQFAKKPTAHHIFFQT